MVERLVELTVVDGEAGGEVGRKAGGVAGDGVRWQAV